MDRSKNKRLFEAPVRQFISIEQVTYADKCVAMQYSTFVYHLHFCVFRILVSFSFSLMPTH